MPNPASAFVRYRETLILVVARQFLNAFAMLVVATHIFICGPAAARAIDLVYDDSQSMRGFVRGSSNPSGSRKDEAVPFRQLIDTLETSLSSIGAVRVCSFSCSRAVGIAERGRFQPMVESSYRGTTTRIDQTLAAAVPSRLTVIVTDMFQSDSAAQLLVGAIRPILSNPKLAVGLVATRAIFDGAIDGHDLGSQFGSFRYAGSLPLYFMFVGNVCEVQRALNSYAMADDENGALHRIRTISLISASTGSCSAVARGAELRVLDTGYVRDGRGIAAPTNADPSTVGMFRLYGRQLSNSGQIQFDLPVAHYKASANSPVVKIQCIQKLEINDQYGAANPRALASYPRQTSLSGQDRIRVTVSIDPKTLNPGTVYRVTYVDAETSEQNPLPLSWQSLDLAGRDLSYLRSASTLDQLAAGFRVRNRTPNLGRILQQSWDIARSVEVLNASCAGNVRLYLKRIE